MVIFVIRTILQNCRDFERQQRIIAKIATPRTPLAGLTFAQRRYFKRNTTIGAMRDIRNAARKLKNELFSWILK